MSKYILVVLLIGFLMCCTHCCGAEEPNPAPPGTEGDEDAPETINFDAIMEMCNETFRTPMGLLEFDNFEEKNGYF